MMFRSGVVFLSCAAAVVAAPVFAQKNLEKPIAGPRATALQVTPLYVSPDQDSQRLLRVQTGRELVVAEKSGPWFRVYANTDIQEEVENDPDQPMVGGDSAPPPVSGWVQAKGIVEETMLNADQVIMGAAANEESLASDPRGPANSAQAARLLYRRVAEMFPNSPLAGEAAWRAADIKWQLDKADNATLPSSHQSKAYLRPQMNEDAIKKVIKMYPRTKWAALAAFDLIDNKLCGDWEASPDCPEKEADVYMKYADEYPDGQRTPRALYEAVYRLGAVANMEESAGKHDRAEKAHHDASDIAARLRSKFPDSEYAWRAGALVYKLDEGIPVYGIDLQ